MLVLFTLAALLTLALAAYPSAREWQAARARARARARALSMAAHPSTSPAQAFTYRLRAHLPTRAAGHHQ